MKASAVAIALVLLLFAYISFFIYFYFSYNRFKRNNFCNYSARLVLTILSRYLVIKFKFISAVSYVVY